MRSGHSVKIHPIKNKNTIFHNIFCTDERIIYRTEQSTALKLNTRNNSHHSHVYRKVLERISSLFSAKYVCTASLSVEASIVLPIFIFLMYLLIFPLKSMEEERRMQNYMEELGRKLAVIEYVEKSGAELTGLGDNELITGLAGGLEEGTALALMLSKAGAYKSMDNVSFSSDTAVFSDESEHGGDMFYAELKYSLGMPDFMFQLTEPEKSLIVSRRAWTGSDGGRGRSRYTLDEEGSGSDEDRIVYLGKTSAVYHDDPNCHYLSNVMLSTDASAMSTLRNEGGGKYHSCPSCKPGSTGTVYYFANGTAYHSSESCKAITAYSRAVKFSELDDMHACSYCGKTV